MDTTKLPPDFAEFLRSLASREVEYLLVGGWAVGFHGFPRATADIDVWVRRTPVNASRIVEALRLFGFDVPALTPGLFLEPERVVRMGLPPFRVEILTSISGVEFDACWKSRVEMVAGDLRVPVLSLEDLKRNKRAAGRAKDLADLENLP